MSDEYDISITRACKLMGILEITNEGFWKIFSLDPQGWLPVESASDANPRKRNVVHGFIFRTLDEVRELTEKWMDYYNNERPHNSLNNLAPMEYRLAKTG